MPIITYRIALAGLGHVGSALLAILLRETQSLRDRYGIEFKVTGVAELEGCAIHESGLDVDLLLRVLKEGRSVASLPDVGKPGMQAIEMLDRTHPDILLEATPVNLEDGHPGLRIVKHALLRGIHVVMANKGPLALAYTELASLSDLGFGWGGTYDPAFVPTSGREPCPKLRFSACVAGALPSINIGQRDLAGCRIQRLEAVFNGTTQYILRAMEDGCSYEDALLDAQQRGIAETNPSLDVEGWDAAAKLVIVTNAVLNQSCHLADVGIEGITHITRQDVQAALANGQRIVLVCKAELIADYYRLSVCPKSLPLEHPLSRLTPDEMGVVYYTEDVERLSVASSEPSATPAAAAMLRDMLDIVRK